ncbi:MAG: TolC family protein [Lewinellaceae bacterium]|nr:TolC family protein [Saprospiraceae bacterium]MCB9339910.1 TolC family protein [Lewinellaceae bacterium]
MEFHVNTLVIRLLWTVSILWLSEPILAQVVDFNQLVPPEGQRPTNFEDYLVQLAWLNSPETKIKEFEKDREQKEVELQRMKWMDELKFGFNINEVSLDNVLHPSQDNLVLYPLYQFTAGVSLGSFTTNKKKREIEEVDVKISEMEGNQHKLKIRAETLSRYQKLLLSIESLKIRTKAEEDSRNIYDFANQRFKNAELELDDLLRASESYNNAQEKRLAAEAEIQLSKLALEEMIGVKWEVAKRFEERLKK